MASSSNNALDTLFKLSSEVLEEAIKKMARANKALKEAEEKRDILHGYKQDYVNNLSRLLEKGLAKEAHMNYQNFLLKLDQAISGQEEIVIAAQYQLKLEHDIWQEAQRKKLSYEVLIKRARKKEHTLALKQDQKMMDEFAMRAKRAS